jgi:HSP20 family molecular chaperone IbpA
MFKVRCDKCKNKVNKNFDFCPYCGFKVKKNKEGLLDEVGEIPTLPGMGGFNLNFGEINNLIKQMQKEMLSEKKEEKPGKNFTSFSISISQSPGKKPAIEIRSAGMPKNTKNIQEKQNQQIIQNISEENVEKMTKLPKIEPKSKVRRLSNSVVYEIDLPGIESIKDIFINKIGNSIEIRAVGKNKQYGKILPVALPIKKYSFAGGKLVLELKSQ